MIATTITAAIRAQRPDLDESLGVVVDAGSFESADPDWATNPDHLGWLLGELRASCGPIVVLPDEIVASERPLVLRVDPAGRPHAEHGPAIAYQDGFEVHAWHGVAVPEWVIKEPGRITMDAIDEETNVEVRRVMIERFGADRMIRDGGATLVHEDAAGRLWRRDVGVRPDSRGRDEPIVMVEVQNSTPEADGSRRTYFLRVPPTMATARDAVAWTFEMTGEAYAPVDET